MGPDITVALEGLQVSSCKKVVVSPIGFLCDNAEILYDLDIKAKGIANGRGLDFKRAQTILNETAVVDLFGSLIAERLGIRV